MQMKYNSLYWKLPVISCLCLCIKEKKIFLAQDITHFKRDVGVLAKALYFIGINYLPTLISNQEIYYESNTKNTRSFKENRLTHSNPVLHRNYSFDLHCESNDWIFDEKPYWFKTGKKRR